MCVCVCVCVCVHIYIKSMTELGLEEKKEDLSGKCNSSKGQVEEPDQVLFLVLAMRGAWSPCD